MKKLRIKLVNPEYPSADVRKELADFILRTEVFSMGEECFGFEKAFAKKQGREYAVFVNSGSSANLILIQALLNTGRLHKGDRIGVSAVTWSTNVAPIIQLGLVPVPLDCELDTLNVSPAILKDALPSLQGVFLTNALGYSDNIEEIRRMAEEANVVFIEDNCEALGSRAFGRNLGNFGLASTFSFFLGHHMSTLEGGMVVTDDKELHKALIMARAHGWSRHLSEEHKMALKTEHGVDAFYDLYTFYDLGYNVRPTEINGFLGNLQLGEWDHIVEEREKNFRSFLAAANRNPDIIPLKMEHMDRISSFAMPLIFRDRAAFEAARTRFEEASIEVRPIIGGNMGRQPFFRKYYETPDLPGADIVHQQGFYYANRADLTEEEVAELAKLTAGD